ncbi:MAG: histone deacetylase family protein, partial [Gammaproteobacteria bacterium]|nr:histone deacetylase family protein [Gammaproteobacteria bacterium]
MTTALITHPDCEHHEMPGHPERPDRLRSVMKRLTSSGITREADCRPAEEIDLDLLALIHPRAFVDAVVKASPSEGLVKIDPDTYLGPGSLRAARLA